jgi:alkyl hydroperoxide reductase subunit AhpC
MLKPGDAAPSFDLPCAFDDRISHLSLEGIRSEMVVIFFYPHDFSFVCPTEVIGFHKLQPAFKQEHTSIVGISIDDAESHRRWARELGGLSYPLVADVDGKLARAFGAFDESDRAAMRAAFVLDRQRKITYAVASSINVGRSVSEILRVVRALRTGRECPADWQPGDQTGPHESQY